MINKFYALLGLQLSVGEAHMIIIPAISPFKFNRSS